MSEHEVAIYGADPDTVVSVTVRELRCLCADEWEHCASDEDDSDIAIPERTCHPISAHDAFPGAKSVWLDDQMTWNHAFGLLRFCSICHTPIGQLGMLDAFCPHCGARVVGE